jgi:hypothetical protein
MAVKKTKKKQGKTTENREAMRRTRMLQVIFIAFSVILILSMVLSLANK